MTTEEYSSAVAQALHYKLSQSTRTDISEQELRDMLDMLTDEELTDGMPFNTPDDVADILIEGA